MLFLFRAEGWYPVHGLVGRAPAGLSAEADGTSFLGDPHISIPDNKQNRRNQDIRVPNVRVIDADGEMVGVRSREEALQLAEEAGLDLVEIQPKIGRAHV